MEYSGYLHTNGKILVSRLVFGEDLIDKSSSFVKEHLGLAICESAIEAYKIFEKELHHRQGYKDVENEDAIELPNGTRIYYEDNQVGGRSYISDAIGMGIPVWDTCLVSEATLLAVIKKEKSLK